MRDDLIVKIQQVVAIEAAEFLNDAEEVLNEINDTKDDK